MTWPPIVIKFANAVKIAENSPAEWNNPCSLTGADAGSFPTCGVGNSEGVLKFVNYEDGWNAACIKFDRMFRGKSEVYPLTMTLAEWGQKYSGSANEAENVAAELGIPETTTLAQIAQLPETT